MPNKIDINQSSVANHSSNISNSASSINGKSYVCPSFATVQSTIISNLSASASMYSAANAYKQDYLDNTEYKVTQV